jgi:hypothetical protein
MRLSPQTLGVQLQGLETAGSKDFVITKSGRIPDLLNRLAPKID